VFAKTHYEVNNMNEDWKRIANTEYKVSNKGEIYSEKSAKLLRQNDDGNGYMKVTLWIDGMQSSEKVHRLVATAFLPKMQHQTTVNHKDGDKLNNCVSNLEWLSHSDNMRHAHITGLMQKGSECTNAKLDEASVEAIKLLFVDGLSNQEIANSFGVERGTIGKIRQLKTWKHVRPDLVFPESSPTVHRRVALTPDDIPKIRELYAKNVSLAGIGKMFGVHSGTISGIVSGKTWKNY
jgi:predicted DNA-binding protein (UPF0251 family)